MAKSDSQVLCLVCSKNFKNREILGSHVRKEHKLSKQKYYARYHPRKDLYTKQLIPVSGDIDTYLTKNFICRKNMMSWLKIQPKEEAIKIAVEALRERRDKKNLQFAPSETDNKTTYIPSIRFYQKHYEGGYQAVCKLLNLKPKYDYNIPENFTYINHIANIQIDTREQLPLLFNNQNVTNEKLDFGDYRLFNDKYEIYFERKSCADFVSTLSRHNFSRFEEEIKRARDKYLIILVEDPINTINEFKTNYRAFTKSIVSPEYLFHNMRDLTEKYHNIQFLFVEQRDMAVEAMNNIFSIADIYKNYDLQLCYDLGLI